MEKGKEETRDETYLEERCRQLEAELEYMTGLMEVMRGDLQIKDEQFDFLYSSLRARTQQNVESRELDHRLLKNRVDYLESAICGKEKESKKLRAQLDEAELKICRLSGDKQLASKSKCFLTRLPDDILFHIAQYIDTKGLGALGCTDRFYSSFVSDDKIWRPHYRYYWGEQKYNGALSKAEGRPNQWKSLFSDNQILESSWKRHRCNVTNLVAHNGTVTCVSLHGKRMFSGSDDGSMICWEIDDNGYNATFNDAVKLSPPPALPLAQLVDAMSSGINVADAGLDSFHHQLHKNKYVKKCICSKRRTFHGHGGPVWCLDYDEIADVLYSGSYDQTIKVWDVKTQACRQTLRGHTGWVSAVSLLRNEHYSALGKPVLVSTSWDSTIRLWQVGNGDEVVDGLDHFERGSGVMNAGQGCALYCVGITGGGRVVNVGCRHFQIQRWDIERTTRISDLFGHAKEVQAIDTTESVIVSGSGDATAKLWDILTDRCSLTLRGHTDSVMAVQFDGTYKIVTGSYDKCIKVWDIRNPSEAVSTITSHEGAVFCLKFDDSKLISGGSDKILKIFDYRLNENCKYYGCTSNSFYLK